MVFFVGCMARFRRPSNVARNEKHRDRTRFPGGLPQNTTNRASLPSVTYGRSCPKVEVLV